MLYINAHAFGINDPIVLDIISQNYPNPLNKNIFGLWLLGRILPIVIGDLVQLIFAHHTRFRELYPSVSVITRAQASRVM